MIDYQQFHQIRFCSEKLKMSKAQIARSLGISESSVRRWLAKDAYGRKQYKKRAGKLEPYHERIQQLLGQCPEYSSQQIFQFIKQDGYEGGLTIVKDYLKQIRPRARKVYLSLNFPPGESAQVDWGCAGYLEIGGRKRKVSYFVMVLCYSRMMFVKFTLTEAQEAWSECHRDAFEYFGGVPRRVMVDNCKTAVLSNRPGETPVLNASYLDLARHYGFEIVPCNVRQPQEKGRVENGVGYVRKNFLVGRSLDPFPMLNIDIREWLDETANIRTHGTTDRRPVKMLAEEKLQTLPLHPYDCRRRVQATVNRQHRIRFDGNTYTVPAEYAFEQAEIAADCEKVEIYSKGRLIASHVRSYGRRRDVEDQQHARRLIETRKRAAEQKMMGWFLRLTPQAESFYELMKKRTRNPYHEILQLYALGQTHPAAEIARAVEDALHFEVCNAAYVRNILEQKNSALPEAGALHIPHKSDALKISLNTPDLALYESK